MVFTKVNLMHFIIGKNQGKFRGANYGFGNRGLAKSENIPHRNPKNIFNT